MHIFSKKKKEEPSELFLREVKEKPKYDFFAALAKALLLFLLTYGAIGGFLSAFEMEYNTGLCMIVLFLLSFILSSIYETGKRWLMNLLTLCLFGVYLSVAMSNYWAINSGYYYVMNRIFGKAREYLGISGGVEYSTVVQDEYSSVTIFVLFLGMVCVILLNIQMQSKCSLLKTVFLTFTPYVVPFYLECNPSLIYMILLFTGYVTVAVLQNSNVKEQLSGQMRCMLPVAVVGVMLFLRMASFVVPETLYQGIVRENPVKTSTREAMGKFAQYGMSVLFQRGSTGAGISGGALSRGSAVMPNYETDLIVRYTPYSFDGVYLKAFTGKDYTGDCWTPAGLQGKEDIWMKGGVKSRKVAYENNNTLQGRGIMEVEYVGADASYEYRPYYTDYGCVEKLENGYSYTYYPAGGSNSLKEKVDATYLSVPGSCVEAVETICTQEGFAGEAPEVAQQIVQFFEENYSYTLRPGYYYGNPDYISHFLLESKKGYCAHFASSATMLFRYMGIPARYVEGYAFSYSDVVDDGELVEGAAYSDYYDGYAPIGETALIQLEIPDAYAHAWVEIYVDGTGWIVVDPTPASTEQDTTSFWDAFMNMGQETEVPGIAEGNLGTYLENAMGGVSYLLLAVSVVAVFFFVGKGLFRRKKEAAMSDGERLQLEYGRLVHCLQRKDKEHARLATLAAQLDCMRDIYGMDISREWEENLYQAFFAPDFGGDMKDLRRELVKMRGTLKRKHKCKN